ncbi:unnamed protein product [Haemonchus placei]|uniref:Uncharacterized protein n=1 Tax=Haemonchus placei TaxID=6290 RepID=A0A0N4WRA4_HAEPC|nr:unnamed protein product [Haemonchus placei]
MTVIRNTSWAQEEVEEIIGAAKMGEIDAEFGGNASMMSNVTVTENGGNATTVPDATITETGGSAVVVPPTTSPSTVSSPFYVPLFIEDMSPKCPQKQR